MEFVIISNEYECVKKTKKTFVWSFLLLNKDQLHSIEISFINAGVPS